MNLPNNQSPSNQNQEPELSDFSQSFLKNVEEADQAAVTKYLKQIDSGINEKFREKDETVKKYADLGEYEELQQILSYVAYLNDNPLEFYDRLQVALEAQLKEREKKVPDSVLPEWEGVPQEFVDQFLELRQELGNVKNELTSQGQSAREREFDSYMKNLHTDEGQFDDDWVMTYLARNEKATGKQAVEAFHEMRKSYDTPKEKVIPPAPNIPAGNGSVFTEQVDMKKLRENKEERLDLITRALERAKTA